MALITASSPHAHQAVSTPRIMALVLIATLPGVAAMTWHFGFGTLVNIAWGSALALAFESLALALRRRPLRFYLGGGSALVSGGLLGIALPPAAPRWLSLARGFCASR